MRQRKAGSLLQLKWCNFPQTELHSRERLEKKKNKTQNNNQGNNSFQLLAVGRSCWRLHKACLVLRAQNGTRLSRCGSTVLSRAEGSPGPAGDALPAAAQDTVSLWFCEAGAAMNEHVVSQPAAWHKRWHPSCPYPPIHPERILGPLHGWAGGRSRSLELGPMCLDRQRLGDELGRCFPSWCVSVSVSDGFTAAQTGDGCYFNHKSCS